LTWMEATTGPAFAHGVAPGGVLRGWVIGHLVDETGESPSVVEVAVDDWLAGRNSDADRPVDRLDDQIEMLLAERRQLDIPDDALDAAFVDSQIGAAFADIGRPIDALGRFMSARDAFVILDQYLDVGVADMEIAMIATDLGWYGVAERTYAHARPRIARYGGVGDFARVLVNEANLKKARGDTDEALDLAERARWLAYESGESSTFAVATHNIANIASNSGDLDMALQYFAEARSIYEDQDEAVKAADCVKNAGAALIEAGQYAEGLEMVRDALAIYEEHGHPIEAGYARLTIAHALDHLARHEDAEDELRQARETFDGARRIPDVASTDINLSYTLRSLHRFDDAAAAVRRAQSAYTDMGGGPDDEWFTDTLAAIERHEVDSHDHGQLPEVDPVAGDREVPEGWSRPSSRLIVRTLKDGDDLEEVAAQIQDMAFGGVRGPTVNFTHGSLDAAWRSGVLIGDEILATALRHAGESTDAVTIPGVGHEAVPTLGTLVGAWACGAAVGAVMTGDRPPEFEQPSNEAQ
jgi:tetratricopeptide (TPR) repeat protein